MRTFALTLSVLLAACAPEASDSEPAAPADTTTGDPSTPEDAATNDPSTDTDAPTAGGDEAAELRFLREEEKLARDVYLTLDARWGSPQVFLNISRSEQSHMDALLVQLDRLGIPDPIVDDAVGAFVDPTLAALFVELTTAGDASVEAALVVGATIEDLDLVDLVEAAETTTDPALIETYGLLACGSRNHLRSFTDQLARRGETYTPEYLDQATYDAILGGPSERCGG